MGYLFYCVLKIKHSSSKDESHLYDPKGQFGLASGSYEMSTLPPVKGSTVWVAPYML